MCLLLHELGDDQPGARPGWKGAWRRYSSPLEGREERLARAPLITPRPALISTVRSGGGKKPNPLREKKRWECRPCFAQAERSERGSLEPFPRGGKGGGKDRGQSSTFWCTGRGGKIISEQAFRLQTDHKTPPHPEKKRNKTGKGGPFRPGGGVGVGGGGFFLGWGGGGGGGVVFKKKGHTISSCVLDGFSLHGGGELLRPKPISFVTRLFLLLVEKGKKNVLAAKATSSRACPALGERVSDAGRESTR